jgi:AcrR family transcriptional regulator
MDGVRLVVPLSTIPGCRVWYAVVPKVKGRVLATKPTAAQRKKAGDEAAVRQRILEAAFAAFMKQGFAVTSTLEIATRARVSKRELYALVGTKEEMLVACVTERARRLEAPADQPEPRDREAFAKLLAAFGAQLLREVTDPTVVGVFRLAIAEALHAPEVARVLDSVGRAASRTALRKIMTQACTSGLADGHPAELSQQFAALLFGDVMVGLLLGTEKRPKPEEMEARACSAVVAFLQLHPLP